LSVASTDILHELLPTFSFDLRQTSVRKHVGAKSGAGTSLQCSSSASVVLAASRPPATTVAASTAYCFSSLPLIVEELADVTIGLLLFADVTIGLLLMRAYSDVTTGIAKYAVACCC
jgi:hypothetical protein